MAAAAAGDGGDGGAGSSSVGHVSTVAGAVVAEMMLPPDRACEDAGEATATKLTTCLTLSF